MGNICISPPEREWLEGVYQKLLVKMKAECTRVGTMIPYMPHDGHYQDLERADGLYWWTNGFWPGILWQMYETTGDEAYREAAEGVEDRMDETLHGFEGLYHDVGFMFLPMSVANYRKTGNADSRRRSLHAANILAGRYNPAGKFIRAWNNPPKWSRTEDVSGWMIIDCLMNLPLLYWASQETGDPRFSHIAVAHAKTAQQHIVRPDGSCNHILSFNPHTGELLECLGGQGYDSNSAWSRGQAWGIYGFALSYRYTNDKTFLDTAKQCAHYCIANLSANGWIPLVDYRAPEKPVKYDSTAGMATACGLLELAEHVGVYEKKMYIQAAINILMACDAKFNNWNPEVDSIVDGGTFFYHDPAGNDSGVPIIYGDYYLIEAILRLKGSGIFIW